MMARVWAEWQTALVLVKPETVIAWRRQGFRLRWTWKSRRRLGRPTVPADIRILIRSMAETNPRWGAPRIHVELLTPGIDACQVTVAKYMGRRRPQPSQTSRTFLRNHVGQIVERFVGSARVFRSCDRVQRSGRDAFVHGQTAL